MLQRSRVDSIHGVKGQGKQVWRFKVLNCSSFAFQVSSLPFLIQRLYQTQTVEWTFELKNNVCVLMSVIHWPSLLHMTLCWQSTNAGETLQANSWIQMHPSLVFESKSMIKIGKGPPCHNVFKLWFCTSKEPLWIHCSLDSLAMPDCHCQSEFRIIMKLAEVFSIMVK